MNTVYGEVLEALREARRVMQERLDDLGRVRSARWLRCHEAICQADVAIAKAEAELRVLAR